MIFDYPYTDMHELNLDWFLAKFKELVEEWNQVQGEWTSLHDYVQNYFDNLNVQTEIDNKINAMILDGSFATIVTPLVEAALPTIVDGKLPAVVASQISAVVADQIGAVVAGQLPAVAASAAAAEVGTWLAAHIDPDTGYVIDKSLTVSDAAADAKKVGDMLDIDPQSFPGSIDRGSIASNGHPYEDQSTHQNRVFSTSNVAVENGWIVTVKDGFRYIIFYYNSDSATYAMENSGWQTSTYTINSQYSHMRIVIGRVTEDAQEIADVDEFKGSVICYTSELSYQIHLILDDITNIQKDIDNIEGNVVDYWQTYLTGIISTLRSNLYDLGNHGDSLYFFTDYHYDKNADSQTTGEKLKNIIAWLLNRLETRKVICGGDIIQINDTVGEALAVLNTFYQNFHKTSELFYNIVGNHDNNQYQSDARLTDSQMYQPLFVGFDIENKAELTSDMYYYFDNKPQKIRYICLNTRNNITQFRIDTNQGNWLIDTLNATPNGYSIVVIMHWFFEPDGGSIVYSHIGTWVESLLNAYNSRGSGTWTKSDGTNTTTQTYDFTNAVGKIIGVLSGHCHQEYEVDSIGNYPIISIPCDAYNGSNQVISRTLGTYTEHSIYQVCIDLTNKSIKLTPIGAGSPHTYYFDQP